MKLYPRSVVVIISSRNRQAARARVFARSFPRAAFWIFADAVRGNPVVYLCDVSLSSNISTRRWRISLFFTACMQINIRYRVRAVSLSVIWRTRELGNWLSRVECFHIFYLFYANRFVLNLFFEISYASHVRKFNPLHLSLLHDDNLSI